MAVPAIDPAFSEPQSVPYRPRNRKADKQLNNPQPACPCDHRSPTIVEQSCATRATSPQMASSEKNQSMAPSKVSKAAFLPPATRKSLIERLEKWDDRTSWDEFYRTYATFVFRVACKAGLNETEANDVVQETFIRVAKNLKAGKFDRNKGSFKSWLMNQCRWRIIDQFRARSKDFAASQPMRNDDGERRTDIIENYADPKGNQLERMWNQEWSSNITELGLRAIKSKVSPLQYQIFFCYVVKEWGVDKVKEELEVTATQVYLAKHRVGRLMRKEIERLEAQEL